MVLGVGAATAHVERQLQRRTNTPVVTSMARTVRLPEATFLRTAKEVKEHKLCKHMLRYVAQKDAQQESRDDHAAAHCLCARLLHTAHPPPAGAGCPASARAHPAHRPPPPSFAHHPQLPPLPLPVPLLLPPPAPPPPLPLLPPPSKLRPRPGPPWWAGARRAAGGPGAAQLRRRRATGAAAAVAARAAETRGGEGRRRWRGEAGARGPAAGGMGVRRGGSGASCQSVLALS